MKIKKINYDKCSTRCFIKTKPQENYEYYFKYGFKYFLISSKDYFNLYSTEFVNSEKYFDYLFSKYVLKGKG